MQKISSKNNPIIKSIRALAKKKYRWNERLYIIEGIKLLEEALDNKLSLKQVLFSKSLLNTDAGKNLLDRLVKEHELIEVDDSLFKSLSDTDNPQGILALVEFDKRDYRELLGKEDIHLVYLDALTDPGNLGTVIRSADAFNIDGVILGEGSVDPYNPKVVRATMGSLFRVPLYFDNKDYDVLKDLKNQQYKIYTSYLKGSVANYNIHYRGSYIIVIGNESSGVRQEIVDISDALIKIPIPGRAESLNAGVASSILMYEVSKQG